MEQFFLKLSIMLVPALMAITCHEVSHGFVADKLGDDTARSMGRLTLNPLKHMDIFGTIMVFVVGIGWAKPVPVNFNRLRRPKTDMIWVAAAGPITNFVLAVVSALVLRFLISATAGVAEGTQVANLVDPITLMLAFSVYINLLLGIFNLITLCSGSIPKASQSSTISLTLSLMPSVLAYSVVRECQSAAKKKHS